MGKPHKVKCWKCDAYDAALSADDGALYHLADAIRLIESVKQKPLSAIQAQNMAYNWYGALCLYHNSRHCLEHAQNCLRRQGHSVLVRNLARLKHDKEFCTAGENEYCKLSTWSDQIDLKLFRCAECKQVSCKCKDYALALKIYRIDHNGQEAPLHNT